MVTPIVFGLLAAGGAGLIGRSMLQRSAEAGRLRSPILRAIAGVKGEVGQGPLSGKEWAIGGFQAKMDKHEAADILGIKLNQITSKRLKDAHRKIMIANHPDRGGSPYVAAKVNEAKGASDIRLCDRRTQTCSRRPS